MKDCGARLAPSPPQLNSAPFMPFVVFCTGDDLVNLKLTRMPLSGKAISHTHTHTHTHTHILTHTHTHILTHTHTHSLSLSVCLFVSLLSSQIQIFILFQNAPVNEAVLERKKN
jgi:hypothetical protein